MKGNIGKPLKLISSERDAGTENITSKDLRLPREVFCACFTVWYPSLNKNLSKKIQTAQNKCIRFCFKLYWHRDEFNNINWLPTAKPI